MHNGGQTSKCNIISPLAEFFSLERHFNATHRRCPYFSERTCNYGSITGRPHASVRRIYDVTHCFFFSRKLPSVAAWPASYALHYITVYNLHYIQFLLRDIVHSAVLRLHVVRPSVCLHVTLVDQDRIAWKFWKLIARPTPSLFVAQRPST